MRFIPLYVATIIGLSSSAYSITLPPGLQSVCSSPKVASETYIGKDKNVKVETIQCAEPPRVSSRDAGDSLVEKRQTNVCGATCTTNCFTPSGGGPNPNDCHVITEALIFDSQNDGDLFTMNPANNTAVITMTFSSCATFIVDQAGIPLTYCRSDWASVLDFVAFNCQSTQNAHGGNCVATSQEWFIQVDHS